MAPVGGGTLTVGGVVDVPGDKSISHRALILASIASGRSTISGLLCSGDVRSTAEALRSLGIAIGPLAESVTVEGKGFRGLRSPSGPLNCGNSGTTARLLAGIIGGSRLTATFVGDESLSRRPMARVARPLEAMGVAVELPPHGGLPLTIRAGPGSLRGVEWTTETPSAQVKSAVLLAGLSGGVRVTVHEPAPTRDHTERMLAARGAAIRTFGTTVELEPSAALEAIDLRVPGDPSSAALLAALAALASAGSVTLRGVCVNPTRTGFLDALAGMGVSIDLENRRTEGGEPVADLVVEPPQVSLRAVRVQPREVPSMIDEIPMLACLGAAAEGETVITGAGELRVKESDRIALTAANLRAIGVEAEEFPDGLRVRGRTDRPLRGRVRTAGDHRLAMAFGVLGAVPGNAIEIDDPDCVGVSYPEFWNDLRRVVA